MKRIDPKTLGIAAILLAAILFVAVNVISNVWLNNARIDLTEGKSYSTSDQIKPVFKQIKEQIVIRVYYSTAIGDASSRHAVFYQRVRDLLQQYAKLADGKIKLEFYNPQPFSDVEDRAVGFGLQGVPLGAGGEVGYFGLAATNSTDDQQVIPFFNLDREQFLEYDLTKLIYSLSEPNQPKVGLLSSLPIEGAPQGMQFGGQGGPRPWAIMSQIKDFFAITPLAPDVKEIPKDITMLMLVQPTGLAEPTVYAIDQFVMRGGKVLAFVDPNAESEAAMGQGAPAPPDFTGMKKLMKSWGVTLVDNKVAGDLESAMRVNMSMGARPVVADYVAWMALRDDNVDHNDAITGDLHQLNFGTAGVLEKAEGATTTVTPLVSTGLKSERIDTDKVMGLPDIVALFRDFKAQNKRETIALRASGSAKSAFDAAPAGAPGEFIKQSAQPIQVVVIADTDVLTDRFWTEANNFMGQQVVVPTADNGNLVVNALENLTGSPALSSLRGRGVQSRPFELVDEIRREAELQFRAKEQSLTGRLDELQKKVNAMQPKGADQQGMAILSDDDKRTIESYRGDILATRKQLRDVQRALRENIDRLESVVKFINIGAVPVLFGLALIIAATVRHRRRRRRAAEA